jgi:protein TonB
MIHLTADDRRDLLRWVLSGIIVLTVHGGIAAAMVQWHEADVAAEPTAAMVIDLAPFPVSTADALTEIPPGPEQIEAEAAPDKPVDKPDEKPEENVETKEVREIQPEIAPALDSEIAVAALPPKPEPEAPKPKENQPAAPVTTAPQAPKADIAPVAAAPAQGQPNINDSNAIPTWKTQVVSILERNKRYPAAARARNEQGTTQLAFSLDRQGRVTASKIVRSSGSPALDQESLELVRRAQPFPPPPPAMPGNEISLSVPVRFNMR